MLAGAMHRGYSAAMPPRDPPAVMSPPALLPTLAEAIRRIAHEAIPLGAEHVSLAAAGGRMLVAPVRARTDFPRRDAAAMDGFALARADAENGLRWRIVAGPIAADRRLASGEAVRIATGATLPEGAERIVPIERATVAGPWVSCAEPDGRSHIRFRGSDFRVGDITLAAGRRIDPRALVAAAAADVESVAVRRVARVGVMVRGDLLVAPGLAAERDGAIPDSLGGALALFAAGCGAQAGGAVRIGEDPAALVMAVDAMRDGVDVIVLAGGAAHGARDAAQQALRPLGLDLVFDGLAIRPGRPSWYGRIGSAHVLGLPGNPTAAMTLARLLLAPLIGHLGGDPAAAMLAWEMLPLIAPVPANGARESFLCAAAEAGGVRLLDRRDGSGEMMLAAADRLVVRPAHGDALSAGTMVPTLRF